MRKLVLLIFVLFSSLCLAETYEMVIPKKPGGVADPVGREISKYLHDKFGDTFVVTNKPGGNGKIAYDYLSQKPKDSKTMLLLDTPFLYSKVLIKDPGFDYSSLDLVVPIVRLPMTLSVNKNIGVNTIDDLIKLAKTRPLNCGATTTATEFVGRFLMYHWKLDNVNVIRFGNAGDMLPQLINGNLDCSVDGITSQIELHKANQLKIILIAGKHKNKSVPDVTVLNDIIPNTTFYVWYGIAFNKDSSFKGKNEIKTALKNLQKDPEFIAWTELQNLEISPLENDPQAWLNKEYDRLEKIRHDIHMEKTNGN